MQNSPETSCILAMQTSTTEPSLSSKLEMMSFESDKDANHQLQHTKIQTPWKTVNKMFDGNLSSGNLSLIVGKHETGKTTLAANIAFHASWNNIPSLFISVYESAHTIKSRCVSYKDYIYKDKSLTNTNQSFSLPLYFSNPPLSIIPQLLNNILSKHPEFAFIVLDSLSCMITDRKQYSVLISDLKRIAIDRDCHIQIISSTNKDVEILEELPLESADIDPIDIIWSISLGNEHQNIEASSATITIIRNRYGNLGKVRMLFFKKPGAFVECSLANLSPDDLIASRESLNIKNIAQMSNTEILSGRAKALKNKYTQLSEKEEDENKKRKLLFGAKILDGNTLEEAYNKVYPDSDNTSARSLGNTKKNAFLELIKLDRDYNTVLRILEWRADENRRRGGRRAH